VLAALYMIDEPMVYKNATLVVSATAAFINLIVIFVLNFVSAWQLLSSTMAQIRSFVTIFTLWNALPYYLRFILLSGSLLASLSLLKTYFYSQSHHTGSAADHNRKLLVSRAPTKAKLQEPAYSQVLNQNKINRQRSRSRESGSETVRLSGLHCERRYINLEIQYDVLLLSCIYVCKCVFMYVLMRIGVHSAGDQPDRLGVPKDAVRVRQ